MNYRTNHWTPKTGDCPRVCPQGHACCLDGRRPHIYHICHRETCACHNRARYEAERERRLTKGEQA